MTSPAELPEWISQHTGDCEQQCSRLSHALAIACEALESIQRKCSSNKDLHDIGFENIMGRLYNSRDKAKDALKQIEDIGK